jgi:CubicO group peptidase (beta-lactamase class C family)
VANQPIGADPGWRWMITNGAGHCESGFERVADMFAAQLKSGRDVGGSVGVYLDGKPVVEIWGGSADPGRGVPWAEHTITPIGSTGKALASTSVLILVDRGLLDLDEPVARYWPAFGQNGKDDIQFIWCSRTDPGSPPWTSRSATTRPLRSIRCYGSLSNNGRGGGQGRSTATTQ